MGVIGLEIATAKRHSANVAHHKPMRWPYGRPDSAGNPRSAARCSGAFLARIDGKHIRQ
jgi:hypothetical protein